MLNACKMCILNLEISGNGSCHEEFWSLVSQYQSIVLRMSKPNPPNVPPLVQTHNCTSMEKCKDHLLHTKSTQQKVKYFL